MASERDCVDHLVRVAADNYQSLSEAAALGLLVSRKWDRARSSAAHEIEVAPPRDLSLVEAIRQAQAAVTSSEASQHDNFTEQELNEFRATASRLIIQFTGTLPKTNDSWWRGFWQGVAASWAYAVSIVIAALVIKLSGSDVLTLLRELFGK